MPAVDVDVGADSAPISQKQAPLFVQFYNETVLDERKSKLEGRPQHVTVEFVRIMIPGDKTTIIERPVENEDKRKYRDQYRAFIEEKSQEDVSGQKLSEWPGIPRAIAMDWMSDGKLGVRTVEQLAAVHDGNLGSLGPLGRQYRDKAREYLEVSAGRAPIIQLQDELQKERTRAAFMEKQLAELKEAVEKQAKKAKGA